MDGEVNRSIFLCVLWPSPLLLIYPGKTSRGRNCTGRVACQLWSAAGTFWVGAPLAHTKRTSRPAKIQRIEGFGLRDRGLAGHPPPHLPTSPSPPPRLGTRPHLAALVVPHLAAASVSRPRCPPALAVPVGGHPRCRYLPGARCDHRVISIPTYLMVNRPISLPHHPAALSKAPGCCSALSKPL